jgi:hypothetical protein
MPPLAAEAEDLELVWQSLQFLLDWTQKEYDQLNK